MKLPCAVIQDLLPLYVDGCAAPESRALVEEHIASCPDCSRQLGELRGELLQPPQPEPTPEQEERALQKGLRKIRRRWAASLLAVVLALPLLWMGVNQVRGEGICFTNLDDIWQTQAFLNDLKEGDYESAYDRLNVSGHYRALLADCAAESRTEKRWQGYLEALTIVGEEEYVRHGKELFCQSLEEADVQSLLEGLRLRWAYYYREDGQWYLEYDSVLNDVTFFSDSQGLEVKGGPDVQGSTGIYTSLLDQWEYELWWEYCGTD
ncbi:MAG: zf-HC2 domain-containing protein [Candidatus Onthomonas sp.]